LTYLHGISLERLMDT